MTGMKILGFALVATFAASAPVRAQSDDVIKIAIIEDLSGPFADQGKRVKDLYNAYIDATNAAGGVSVRGRRYKIQGLYEDAQGSPPRAANAAARATVVDRVAVVICSNFGCVRPAEEARTPLILTLGNWSLSGRETNTFLINAPTRDDFETQTKLAIKTLHQALSQSDEPTQEKITAALRRLDITDSLGAVRFDKAGNNAGRVTYPYKKISGQNQSGCSKSCSSTCPKDCGQTACSKDGSEECCNVCGMPRPPN